MNSLSMSKPDHVAAMDTGTSTASTLFRWIGQRFTFSSCWHVPRRMKSVLLVLCFNMFWKVIQRYHRYVKPLLKHWHHTCILAEKFLYSCVLSVKEWPAESCWQAMASMSAVYSRTSTSPRILPLDTPGVIDDTDEILLEKKIVFYQK